MSKKYWKSAEELMSELNNDPEYLAKRQERDKKFQQLESKYAELARPVLELLRSKGFDADSIEQLVSKYAPLPSVAISIILDFIEPHQDARHCESMVRALAAAEQPFDGRPLAACYDRTSDESLRWAIANTIALAHPHSIQDWIANADEESMLKQNLTKLGYRP